MRKLSSFTFLYLSVMPLAAALCLIGLPHAAAQDFRSGQDSPVHDSDRLYPIGLDHITLENEDLRVDFDRTTGALTRFENKRTHWSITPRSELAESFILFAPISNPEAARSYNPILGSRNRPISVSKSADGHQLTLIWDGLVSEYSGTLKIRLEATVTLNGSQASFTAKIENHSPSTVSSIEWPILGDLQPPTPTDTLTREYQSYGNLVRSPMYPNFQDQRGDYGTNYPMQVANNGGYGLVRYTLISAPGQGLYMGTHDTTGNELVSITAELKPGYETSYQQRVPAEKSLSNHPARIVLGATHFPFVNPGESSSLAPVVLSPYRGDWHNGVDIYKQWKTTWFREPPSPAWVRDVHSWQQIQINSSEDDLRTPYRDLPRRAQEDASNGVTAIQLVGWNHGGQDRDNPSFQIDPRLGTFDELKSSIAAIEKTGVHVILFQKYTWADLSTADYRSTLHNNVALDPYGIPYQHPGYQYQTPEQLNNINTRRFAPACTADHRWLDLAAKEFQNTLDLGATGMLFDEVFHHGGAFYCFAPDHGHHTPASLWPGDQAMGARFRTMAAKSIGEDHFLFSGEDPYDLEEQNYTLSYFRISPGNIPAERYAAPFRPMMVAVSGFDDREMVNRALMDRYILSYEPFRFKGNLSDFPLTLDYGRKMDALRKHYREYLWDAEFRDTLGATVTHSGQPWSNYTVFRTTSGKQAIVLVNDEHSAVNLSVAAEGASSFRAVSPESPDPRPSTGKVTIPARSAIVLLPQ